MKAFSALALVAALGIIAQAQKAWNNSDEQLRARNAPDVFVHSASAFGPDKNGDSHFTIEVGNTGGKTISAIEWEYYLPGDVAGSDPRVTQTFRNDRLKLHPNERSKLTQQVRRYTDPFVTGFHLDTVRIMRVEYEDRSSWKRTVEQK